MKANLRATLVNALEEWVEKPSDKATPEDIEAARREYASYRGECLTMNEARLTRALGDMITSYDTLRIQNEKLIAALRDIRSRAATKDLIALVDAALKEVE